MQLSFPHGLGREEALRRIREHEGDIVQIAPGMAEVTTSWPSAERMAMQVTAMGKVINGAVEVGESEVAFHFDLPASLSFAAGMIKSALEPKARKLLGPA